LVRQHPASVEEVIEIRIAVVGNVNIGKNTIFGILVKGRLDDKCGKVYIKYILTILKLIIY